MISSFSKHASSKLRLFQSLHREQTFPRRLASSLDVAENDFMREDEDEAFMTKLFNPTQEHLQLRSMIRSFVQNEVEPQALQYNRTETFNISLFERLGSELGLLGLTAPCEFGGSEMDATAVALVHEEMSYADPAFCLSYLAHSVLFVNNLAVNGNRKHHSMFLPGVCDGSQVAGMCMSEPGAGTDVLGMKSRATYDSNTKSWILNGTKMWITNGTITGKETGDIFLVYAKTGDGRSDLTQFVVQKGMKGFYVGQKIEDKCGMRASPTAELVFDNVVIPQETHVVGEVNNASICMMRNLEIERVALAAMAVGIARRCVDEMIQYSKERKAFGKSTIEYGQIQEKIAESYAEYMAGKCYLYSVANGLDLESYGNGLDADGVKLFAAQMGKNVADRAIQVMGGYGYCGEYGVERLWRDSKLLEIGGGTNESHHKNMIRDLKRLGHNII